MYTKLKKDRNSYLATFFWCIVYVFEIWEYNYITVCVRYRSIMS